MRTLLSLAIMACFATTAMAAEPILGQLKSGQYAGQIASAVSKSLDGTQGKLDIKRTANGTLFTFTANGAKGQTREEWLFQGDALTQTEYNDDGKQVASYAALIDPARPMGTDEATFNVHCADRIKNVCDNGIDSRNAWTIAVRGDTLKYTVWGVETSEQRNDPKAPVVKRHEFTFSAKR